MKMHFNARTENDTGYFFNPKNIPNISLGRVQDAIYRYDIAFDIETFNPH